MNNPMVMTTIEHIRRPNDATVPQPELSENSDQSSRHACKVANVQRTTSPALKLLTLSCFTAYQRKRRQRLAGLTDGDRGFNEWSDPSLQHLKPQRPCVS